MPPNGVRALVEGLGDDSAVRAGQTSLPAIAVLALVDGHPWRLVSQTLMSGMVPSEAGGSRSATTNDAQGQDVLNVCLSPVARSFMRIRSSAVWVRAISTLQYAPLGAPYEVVKSGSAHRGGLGNVRRATFRGLSLRHTLVGACDRNPWVDRLIAMRSTDSAPRRPAYYSIGFRSGTSRSTSRSSTSGNSNVSSTMWSLPSSVRSHRVAAASVKAMTADVTCAFASIW